MLENTCKKNEESITRAGKYLLLEEQGVSNTHLKIFAAGRTVESHGISSSWCQCSFVNTFRWSICILCTPVCCPVVQDLLPVFLIIIDVQSV